MNDNAMTNTTESWFSRNDWVQPIIGSIIMILAAMMLSTLLQGSGKVLPSWLFVLVYIGSCAGLLFGALKARLTNTISAQIFCYLALAAGWIIAIWQILDILKR